MIRLTREEILLLHEKLIERYGGTYGLRDDNLLDSALNAPFQSFGDQELYPTTIEKTVRLCFGLVKNHPFHDGNKRIGALVLLTTLDLNHVILNTNSVELTEIILSLATGNIDCQELLEWAKERID